MAELTQGDLFVGDQDDVNELYRQVFQYRNGRKFKEMAGAGETCGRCGTRGTGESVGVMWEK